MGCDHGACDNLLSSIIKKNWADPIKKPIDYRFENISKRV